MKNIPLLLLLFVLSACSGNNPKAIADEYCNCREIEKNEGALQGNQCYEKWDKKYGEVKLNEEQQKVFLEITQECN